MSATGLVEELRLELAPVEEAIRDHRFLAELEAGHVSERALGVFGAAQRVIIASDRRSFAHLAARYPEAPAGDLFLGLARSEGEALGHLDAFEAAVGPGEGLEPPPGALAYTGFVSWLALNGTCADVAVAFLANLDIWGESCRRIASALRPRYDDRALAFFDFFGQPAPGFEEQALAVVEQGLADGESAEQARRAARLLQAYELLYWDALADAL